MTCRACGGVTDPVFEMDPMPLAGGFTRTLEEAKAATRYPLTWSECGRCGLVNVSPDISDDILFAQYAYRASDVPALVRHHRAYAATLRGHFNERARILEIGCNDGVLLRELPETWEKIGVDPSDIAVQADHRGWEHVHAPFTSALASGLGTFDLVTSSNAFAHFTGIGDAIAGIAKCLAPGGLAVIEVHDLDATLASGQWDTIYHEHKVEWSADSLAVAFAGYGLRLTGVDRLDLHGGLIRAWFRRSVPYQVDRGSHPAFESLRASYAARRASAAYPEMMQGGAAYGAAGRATVYLNQIPELPLDYVVDSSPRRAGWFVPGIGLGVVPPETFDAQPPRATLITAWNHAPDIMAKHPGYDRWVSAW